MEDKNKESKTVKAALIAAVAAIVVALITVSPSIMKLFSSSSTSKDKNLSIENINGSTIITGNNNAVKNEK